MTPNPQIEESQNVSRSSLGSSVVRTSSHSENNEIRNTNTPVRSDPPTAVPHESVPEPAKERLVVPGTEEDDQHPETTSGESGLSSLLKSFVWEILAILLALGLLIAIAVLLGRFNHQAQPTWKYVSLNSAVAWLSTISKGCVLFAASEGLGQLKWQWFTEQKRPISDLRTFDGASRGLYGSGELIWSLRMKHFAVLGSFAVILGVAFQPFTQNLIHYYPQLVTDASQKAILANSRIYDEQGLPWNNGEFFYLNPSLKANIYNSLFNSDPSRPWAIPRYACSTGNCTWDPIATLEMQANCKNITDHLQVRCIQTNASSTAISEKFNCSMSLPGGPLWKTYGNISVDFFFNTSYGTPVGIGAGNPIFYTDEGLRPIQLIGPEKLIEAGIFNHESKWQAIECALKPIVRSFRAEVIEGTYQEETIGLWTNGSITSDPDEIPGYYVRPTWGPDMGADPKKPFYITSQTILTIEIFLKDFFGGHARVSDNSVRFIPQGDTLYAGTDLVQAISYGNLTGCESKNVEKLRCAMENVAKAMSKTFRDNSFMPDIPQENPASLGHAKSNMTYVAIHWQWIILPALVWLLGAITLLGSMWKSRKAMTPIWKNDPMPLLFLYETGQDENLLGHGIPRNSSKVMLYRSEGKMVLDQ
ncbi:uncharacterized protein N7500_002554 [Penicillium coprophilum]|uniref:uncharacterized protein n=1 Tax=Penicillium coprophilum TaxID=36646 RepID=UPI00238F2160|nr:uncharacterized protein N7500_002554 [Penicillium coprophilum]KAJ5169771.1 hypothetical protein N7500_002554 [Penicillium coprophilum]